MATIDRRGATISAADPPIATNPNPDLAIKAPCLVATTGAITLSGLQTVDGVALAAGNRVLVKNQAVATLNGIYNASTGVWTRAIDASGNSQWANGTLVPIARGTSNANAMLSLTAADPIVLGTSSLTFATVYLNAARHVNTTAPLAGGGDLSADRTLTLTINSSLQVTGGALALAALGAVSHQWVSSINAAGAPQLTQPAFTDISGSVAATQMPALTGDVTTVAGAVATTIAAGAVTYTKIQSVAASRLLGNPTGAPAAPSEISLGFGHAFSGTSVAVGLTSLTASLGADVALNNAANYFDGPSVAQGVTGTWLVSGTVTLSDTGGSAGSFFCKLWDGTTVIASVATAIFSGATFNYSVSLSGIITAPAGNLRISVRDAAATTGKILFNATGNSKDSTITAVRIA